MFNAACLYAELRRDAADPSSHNDFGRNIIPHLVRQRRVAAHHFADSCVNMIDGQSCWRDVGTVDACWEANMDLTRPLPELNLYDDAWPIRSMQH